MSDIIRIKNLYFTYSLEKNIKGRINNWVLININFTIKKGEFIVIAGANGSGKSTLLRLIDLLLIPTRGEIYVLGKKTSSIKDPYEIRSKIGFVFQNPIHQMITTTVLDEIVFGPENLGLSRSVIKKRINEAIELTGIKDLLHRRMDALSGGQKQLVAIASVLTMDPEVLLFDEPASMLHPEYHERIIEIIKNLNKIGKTIILVTHNSRDFLLGKRIFIIKNGKLIFDSTPESLLENHIEIIEESGLDVPFPVKISWRLKKEVGEIPVCMNLEDLANKIAYITGIN